METGGRDAKNPVLIAGVPSPSSSRFNFRLPAPFQFTTATQAKGLTRAIKKEINITFFFRVSLYLYRITRENLG